MRIDDAIVELYRLLVHHDYIELDEIDAPGAPDADKLRVYAKGINGVTALCYRDATGSETFLPGGFNQMLDLNDSVGLSADLAGLYYRRPDGLMVKLSDDFPYSRRLRHCASGTYPHGDIDEVELENSWANFAATYSGAAFTKDFLGCVWVQGMIKSGTINTTAFTLPEAYRNEDNIRLLFPSISNNALGRNEFMTSGIVNPIAGNNAWVSLALMAGPAVGRMTWHDVGGGGEPAFENNWVNHSAAFGEASFAKDAIGRVWIRGLVKDGDANTTVFTLPAGYRPTADTLRLILVNNNVVGRLGILNDGSVVVNVLGGTNAWASITAVFTADGAATWHEIGGGGEPAFENSWVNFGGTYNTAAFYKDACGIVHIKGLIKDGTIGQTAFILPAGYRPKQRLSFPTISNNGFGQMEIYNYGRVQIEAGNNAWFTVHCSFIAEQ